MVWVFFGHNTIWVSMSLWKKEHTIEKEQMFVEMNEQIFNKTRNKLESWFNSLPNNKILGQS